MHSTNQIPTLESTFPPPCAFGGPEKFDSWRQNQYEALSVAADSSKRFIMQLMPTGFGKSLVYVMQAIMSGKRTVILTSTKGLQNQLMRDFAETGLVDVRGMQNYRCVAAEDGRFGFRREAGCDEGLCHSGAKCELKNIGCEYYDATRAARIHNLVVTNYSYWLTINRWGNGLVTINQAGDVLNPVEILVLDEAHDAPDELADFLGIKFTAYDLESILRCSSPPPLEFEQAKIWAKGLLIWVNDTIEEQEAEIRTRLAENNPPSPGRVKYVRTLKQIRQNLSALATAEGYWIGAQFGSEGRGVRYDPVDVSPYGEILFRGINKVIFVSATASKKTAQLLGVKDADLEYKEYPSTFPVKRRPVYHVPTIQVNYRTTPEQMMHWVNRIDQIIDRRLDRRGIIHTVSYKRRDFLLNNSRHRRIMITHSTKDVAAAVELFKNKPVPAVLVSPSMVTGWDFPYSQCEYQVIGKIGFPDSSNPIIEARQKHDPSYGLYIAMMQLVQAVGRGMRAEDDQCECFVVDDNIRWFMNKARQFAPSWFTSAIKYLAVLPDPLPAIVQEQDKEAES